MKKIIKKIRNSFRIIGICFRDMFHNIKYCGFYNPKIEKNKWKILLLAHSIEKGLSMPNKKNNFGEEKALDLYNLLNNYNNKDSYEYKEGYSILKEYLKYRNKNNLSNLNIKLIEDIETIPAGSYIVTKKELEYDTKKFIELCDKRHSVREYDKKLVKYDDILKAIDIAKQAPSACNRQMIKVYTSDSLEVNKELAKLIPGNNGFKNETARYLFLVSDKNAYDYYEIDQWYLNGGIFVGFLQLALTSLNIGSCIYQWPKDKKRENNAKKILNISNSETIVSVISVGYYKDNFEVLSSTRKEKDDYINKI